MGWLDLISNGEQAAGGFPVEWAMKNRTLAALTVASISLIWTSWGAQAATWDLTYTGAVAVFTTSSFNFDGFNFEQYSLPLTETDGLNPVVSQGDTIDSTVTLDQAYAIAQAPARNYYLQYFFGSGFTGDGTAVNGVFTFYNAGTEVASYVYSSTTSSELASFAALYQPLNTAFTFDSFTNDLTISTLSAPASLTGSSFEYDLLTSAVPETSTWAMLLTGFIGLGFVGYRKAQNGRVVLSAA
jgi:hypothetical protein